MPEISKGGDRDRNPGIAHDRKAPTPTYRIPVPPPPPPKPDPKKD